MAKRRYHFAHHHREAIINRRRFVLTNALLVAAIAALAFAHSQRSSQAATIGGRVYLTTGAGVPGVRIDTCHGLTAPTNSEGYYLLGIPNGAAFCARIASGLPANSSWHAINNNPDCPQQNGSWPCNYGFLPRHPNYEHQLSIYNCYHNSSCLNNPMYYWDKANGSDAGYDFRITPGTIQGQKVPNQAPVAGATVTLDGKTAAGANPYAFTNLLPGNHTVSASTPAGWRLNGFSACTNRTNCHAGPTGSGSSVTVTVPAGGYVDLYWHYSQIAPPPSDRDRDGVVDSNDACPTQAGPASNRGCPVSTSTPRPSSPAPASGSTADTQPPSDPTNLIATYENQEVKLNWTASTDNSVGLKYQVERSLDNSAWSVLSTDVTDVSYQDRNAAFEIKYFYRVKAVDTAGNSSGYVTVEFTTPKFEANVTEDSTIIESDDGLAKAIIPKAAIDGAVACGLVIDGENRDKISPKLFVTAGPYRLRCQTESGDEIVSFREAVTILVTVPKDATKDYTKFKVFSFVSDKWTETKTKYDKKLRQFSFTTTDTNQFVVLGEKRRGIAGIVSIVLLLIGGGGGFFFYRLRQAQKQRYDEYLRKKYYDL